MKKLFPFLMLLSIAFCIPRQSNAQVNNPGTVAQTDATNTTNDNINNTVNNGVNGVANGIKGLFKKKNNPPNQQPANNQQGANGQSPANGAVGNSPASRLASYQNYDFIPGNTILFEDEFTDDQSGEFPSHWSLRGGQAILNMVGQDKAFFLTDGNYVHVAPLMTNKSYLTSNFSVEYDVYGNNSYPPILSVSDSKGENFTISANASSVSFSGTNNLGANMPADLGGNNYTNKWHHFAIAYKNNQLKVYIDKYRVLIVPQVGIVPASLEIEGIGSQDSPIIFRNFKIADGVQFYMTGQAFTDAKIVTHGINFDVDKATIKPESMGTLNMVVQVMKSNPTLKFEVDGHTDNTGTSDHNMTLSQQRADAVRTQLITMGIDGSRLSSKGFGDTKPIADNTTFDGKANNRRVEFVKM